MSHLLELAQQGARLVDACADSKAGEVADELRRYIANSLNLLLRAEGPPPEPLFVSEGLRREIVRTEKGRAVAIAETWLTPPWRCLLIEMPSVAMGRPLFIPKHDLTGKRFFSAADIRVITDSRTQRAMRRIVEACHTLEISTPIPSGQGAVHAAFGEHRTFLAWREREDDETHNVSLRADVDNLSKTILDGLQLAGVIRNDAGVMRLSATKSLPAGWDTPQPPLEEVIRQEATRRREAGQDLDQIRNEMRLSRAHMARLFPGEYRLRAGKVRDRQRDAFLARQAAELILKKNTPYAQARRELDVLAAALRKELAMAMRHQVLKKKLSAEEVARILQVEPRTAVRIFQDDMEALKTLTTKKAPRLSRKAARKALDKAMADVLDRGLRSAEAARTHKVSLGSLRAKITREKKRRAAHKQMRHTPASSGRQEDNHS